MNIIIKTKNLERTPQLDTFVFKRIGGLERFLKTLMPDDPAFNVSVELSKETMHHRKGEVFEAGVKIDLPDKNLVANARNEDLYAAIVQVRKELEQEIRKRKVKAVELHRRRYRKVKKEII